MPGWQKSTEDVRSFDDLPDNAKNYVNKIHELLDVPGKFCSLNLQQIIK